jgi:hypothetical protein
MDMECHYVGMCLGDGKGKCRRGGKTDMMRHVGE